MKVLVTGGAGYIGSHTCKALAKAGHEITVFDNLCYGHREFAKWGPLIEGDLANREDIDKALDTNSFDGVIHFAAYAYVGESVDHPQKYYQNNVGGTLNLLDSMLEHDVKNIVFSSTCATYGMVTKVPITESFVQAPINPYGHTKLMIEQILKDYDHAYGLKSVALRYFNAAGDDADEEVGEWHDPEPHLIPLAILAALGKRPALKIFGTDYPTTDGTAIRDYIHVADLAMAHVQSLDYLQKGGATGQFNLGTGNGYSVQQIVDTVADVAGTPVPHEMAPRRAGDPAELVADASLAKQVLGFTPTSSDLETIIKTAWNWHKNHPFAG